MIAVDTGFFLALAEPKDSLHGRANAWAKAITEPLIVTEYVLWETINALSKPPNRQKAHVIVRDVRTPGNYDFIPASEDLFQAGFTLHAERPDKEWSLTDCISFIVMQRRKMTRALTYDHHFEQAGFEALLCREPP